MSAPTKIEWTDFTWSPVTGCSKVSEGCRNCYIERTPPLRMAGRRFACPRCGGTGYVEDADGNRFSPNKSRGLILGARCASCNGEGLRGIGDTTGVRLHEDRLDWPLRKRSWRGKRVFVCSMADLFHDAVPSSFIADVFAVMALTPEVTFQALTKRPVRMRSLLSSDRFAAEVEDAADLLNNRHATRLPDPMPWPLPNVHLGVSVEDQAAANLRIPALLNTPAAVRFLSCEPLLGPVDLGMRVGCPDGAKCHHACAGGRCWRVGTCVPLSLYGAGTDHHGHWTAEDKRRTEGIDWVIVGGESGPGARPMRQEWATSLVFQCQTDGVPVFVKQMGSGWAREHGLRGKADALDELPEGLRVRELPGGAA